MSQIPISEDLDAFFVDGEFAQDVELLGGIISAIVTDYYQDLDAGTVGIEGAEVLLICKTMDIPGVEHGTPVNIDGENFIVVNVRPDNSGVTRLQLARTFNDPIPPGVVTYNGDEITYNGDDVNYG